MLITKNKIVGLEKLKEFNIKDPLLKGQLILEIDEWGRELSTKIIQLFKTCSA